MTTDVPNGNADKFRKLAQKRVTLVLKTVNLIGGLSKRDAYDYSDEQVAKMFSAMRNGIDAAESRFQREPQQLNFSLD